MTTRRVACPKCTTQLMLPAGFTSGNIKCPKCSQVLAIRPPAATAPTSPAAAAPVTRPATRPAAPAPSMPAPVAPAADPFADLPNLPAASAPSGGVSQYRPPPAKPKPAKKKKKTKAAKRNNHSGGSGGGGAGKVLAVLGGVLGVLVLLCGGGVALVGTGLIGPSHSGWKQITYHGYKVNMPGKGQQSQKPQNANGLIVYETATQRRESGSVYGLAVSKMPPEFTASNLKQVYTLNPAISVSGLHDINRNGVAGIKGLVSGGDRKLMGAQIESFFHKGDLVVLYYRPYSSIKQLIGGKRAPRVNEKSLDKPDEFFSSIKFK